MNGPRLGDGKRSRPQSAHAPQPPREHAAGERARQTQIHPANSPAAYAAVRKNFTLSLLSGRSANAPAHPEAGLAERSDLSQSDHSHADAIDPQLPAREVAERDRPGVALLPPETSPSGIASTMLTG